MRKALLASACLAAACATSEKPRPIYPAPFVVRNYEIGSVQTARVGEAIFDVEGAVTTPAFVVLRDYQPPGTHQQPWPALRQHTVLRAVGELGDGTLIVKVNAWDLGVTPEGRALGYRYFNSWGGVWPEEPLLKLVTTVEGLPNAFRAQVIYSGVDGETVRAVYREYSSDFIRAAFSQELQYNIARDSVIAYRSIRIQVIEATNAELRYRVLEDGGLGWLPLGRPR
jgi:hypothetical protein